MFGLIAAYLLGRNDGRRSVQKHGHRDYTEQDIKLMRGVALLLLVLALVVLAASL